MGSEDDLVGFDAAVRDDFSGGMRRRKGGSYTGVGVEEGPIRRMRG